MNTCANGRVQISTRLVALKQETGRCVAGKALPAGVGLHRRNGASLCNRPTLAHNPARDGKVPGLLDRKMTKSSAPKKRAIILASTAPFARGLPRNAAASMGRTIARYSLMDWYLSKMVFNLLGISIKQGRTAVRVPRHQFLRTVKLLLAFHGVKVVIGAKEFRHAMEKAGAARNALAHSVFIKDSAKRLRIQLVSGTWNLGDEFEPVARSLQPETPLFDRAFLSAARRDVDAAYTMVLNLHKLVLIAVTAANVSRRSNPRLERRQKTA